VPSQVYDLFSQAIADRKQVLCLYGGYRRELCPIILGHSKGQEKALTYQFGGESRSGLPRGGEWRCLWLEKVSDVQLRNGPWRAGNAHTQPQGCVETVDLDANPASPYKPLPEIATAQESGGSASGRRRFRKGDIDINLG